MQVGLALKQQTRVSPQLVMAGQLLALPSSALEQAVEAELQRNPALERVRHNVRSRAGRATDADPELVLRTIAASSSAQEQLMAQARLLADRADWPAIGWLIGSLDNHGYLRKTPEALATELGFPLAAIERAVRVLRELDPPGIGARNLRECLLVQCDRGSNAAGHEVARRILVEAWDDFSQQRRRQIAHRLGLTAKEVDDGCEFIRRHLYPYPLLLLDDPAAEGHGFGLPDLIIHQKKVDGQVSYTLEVPGAEECELRISESFEIALMRENLSAGERTWIGGQVESARLFITSFLHRWATLRQIGEYLISHQRAFLEEGPIYLRPLTQATIALELGLHESTVSRAIRGKLAQLPDGHLVPLKDFIDRSMNPREAIQRLLAGHNDWSDRDITNRLRESGLKLSRRTVAKYRAQLNIPTSQKRRTYYT